MQLPQIALITQMVLRTTILDTNQTLDDIAEAIRQLKPRMPGLNVYRGKSSVRVTYTEGKFSAEATARIENAKLHINYGVDDVLVYSMYFGMVAMPVAGITALFLNYRGYINTGGATPFFYALIVWPGLLFLFFKLGTVPKVNEFATKIEWAVKQAEKLKSPD
jgi:hypothetical protein